MRSASLFPFNLQETEVKQWSKVDAWNLEVDTDWLCHQNGPRTHFFLVLSKELWVWYSYFQAFCSQFISLDPSCAIILQYFCLLIHCTFLLPFCYWSSTSWDHSHPFCLASFTLLLMVPLTVGSQGFHAMHMSLLHFYFLPGWVHQLYYFKYNLHADNSQVYKSLTFELQLT